MNNLLLKWQALFYLKTIFVEKIRLDNLWNGKPYLQTEKKKKINK